MPMAITTVILDYGCVLSVAPTLEDYEPLRAIMGVKEPAAFQEIYWRHRDAYDLNTIDASAYWSAMGRAAGMTLSSEQVLHLAALDRQVWGRPNPVMVEWLHVLRERGFKTAMISNLSRNFSGYLRQNANWAALFDHLCFSGELGISKPGAAIFRGCLEALHVAASQALFVDDKEVNIAAAQKLGLKGIVFRSVEQLEKELEPFGLAETLTRASNRARRLGVY